MKATYNIAFNYILYNSVLLDLGTTLYIFNNLARFVSEIKPSTDRVYIGLYTEEIIGFRTATVIINTPEGKEQILLTGAAYVLGFYTNLVYTQKLNKKEVYWNNKENTLFYSDNKIYAYCGYYCG